MAESLERSKGLEQQFLLSVSHDLRTPLTSIRGYAEAISDGTAPDARRRRRSSPGRRGGSSGWWPTCSTWPGSTPARSRSSMAEVDLGARRRAARWQPPSPRSRRSGLTVDDLDPAVGRHRCAADPERLRPGGRQPARERPEVRPLVDPTWRSGRSRRRAELAVEDDGPGIAAEDLPHVFERLYVSAHRPVRSESGSGLGLAIVRQLVEAMGGSVEAGAAGSGGGARLTVTLPLLRGDQPGIGEDGTP